MRCIKVNLHSTRNTIYSPSIGLKHLPFNRLKQESINLATKQLLYKGTHNAEDN